MKFLEVLKMQISEVKYSELEEASRIGGECYHPLKLKSWRVLENNFSETIGNFFNIIKKSFTPFEIQKKRNVKLLELENMGNFEVKNIPNVYSGNIKSNKYLANKNDVVISRLRPYLKQVAFLNENNLYTTTELNILELKKNIDSRYSKFLYFYLCSRYCQNIFYWSQEGTNHPRFPIYILENMPFGFVKEELLDLVDNSIYEYYEKQTKSKELYKQAEDLLLEELSLKDFKPKNELTYEANVSEVLQVKRFDAEYFQPKYKEIIEKIESYENGYDLIGNIVNWKKGYEVGSEAYKNEGIDFVRVSNFSEMGVEKETKKISEELYDELKDIYQPKKGEILFTKDGTIGISYLLKENYQGILSSAFLRLTLKNKYKYFERECLTLILNSILCKMQIKQFSGGALISHLKPSDFEKLEIPLIKQDIQQGIAELVKESHKLRKESKDLLEEAKRKVEEEIEQKAKEAQ
jgi:restriction endonuclease S subunit